MIAPRKRPIQREHELQKAVFQFVKDAIDLPPGQWLFTAIDAAQQSTTNARGRNAARGVMTGFPDTLLIVRDSIYRDSIYMAELKWGTAKVSDDQAAVIEHLIRMGVPVGVATSVVEYGEFLDYNSAPLRRHWRTIAEDLDLKVAARIAKLEARRDNPGSARASKTPPRFTAGKRFMARVGKKGIRI